MAGCDEAAHDVIVIGAGANGINQLHRLRRAGLDVVALEAGDGVGGTWYWNRYPGARLDSECYTYAYTRDFASEVVDEWSWDEEFADQPTLERYFNFVVDRLDLRRSIRFGARVDSAQWKEDDQQWLVTTSDGSRYRAAFVIAATGILSEPYLPPFPGAETFRGQLVHSSRWPKEGLDLAGKRVGVLGVGSTGIQIIQTIASEVADLTVFQRTPNWAAPLNNYAFDEARKRELVSRADEITELTLQTRSCFVHTQQPRSTWDVTDAERHDVLTELYERPGLSLYAGAFKDLLVDQEANREVTDFLTSKLAERVRDPETLRKLTPTHPFATKRPPMETRYYEVYNQPNVHLVSLPEEPIERWVADGVETSAQHYPLDVMVVATGFDAVTGSFRRLGATGVDGIALGEWWADGPRTNFGIFVHNFPNFFILAGPQGVNGNLPRCADFFAGWLTRLILSLRERGVTRIETTEAAEEAWVDRCNALVQGTLLTEAMSWQWGSNVPGKKRVYTQYTGPQPELRRELDALLDEGLPGLDLAG